MIIGVDHIFIAVASVESAMDVYRRLGFEVQAGGEHPRMGTYNALIPLSDGAYLELIGVKDQDKAQHFPNSQSVLAALGRENRLAGFALDTNDIVADVHGIRARGLDIGEPIEGERMRPDGQKVAWRSAHFRNPSLPFLSQDITPHHVRVPLPASGLGAHAYLVEVLKRVDNLPDASRVWKDLLGRIPPQDNQFKLERASIRLSHAEGEHAGLRAVVIAVDDLDKRVQEMQGRGVKVKQGQGWVDLDPSETAGAWIRLQKAKETIRAESS